MNQVFTNTAKHLSVNMCLSIYPKHLVLISNPLLFAILSSTYFRQEKLIMKR